MKLVKRLSALAFVGFLGLATTSCLNSDDNDYSTFGFFPTTKIEVNQDSIMPAGKTTNVHVTYQKTNSCQEFIQFSLLKDSKTFEQNIGVYGKQSNSTSCTEGITLETKTLKFTPKDAGKYTLRFWTGNEEGSTSPKYDTIVLTIKEK